MKSLCPSWSTHCPSEDEKELLPAGLHEFPFAFNLPPNLPPSFHSDKGFIVYTAIAILDRPAAANLVQKAGFSLHSILDLNMYSQSSVSGGTAFTGYWDYKLLCNLPIFYICDAASKNNTEKKITKENYVLCNFICPSLARWQPIRKQKN